MKNIDLNKNKTNRYIYSLLKSYFGKDIFYVMELVESTPVPLRTFFALESVISNMKDYKISSDLYKPIIDIVSFSPFLTGILKSSPNDYIDYLFINNNISRVFTFNYYVESLKKLTCDIKDAEKFKKTIRLFKRREFLRIAAQDILGKFYLKEIMRQISDLAAAFTEVTAEWLIRTIFKTLKGERYFILGMGKLGGRELNYSSDIDLIYIFLNHEKKYVFTNFFKTLTGMINDITELGFVFRVDLRLRPEGANGPIALDYDSAVFYYENLGRFWERAAMIKATPVAGDIELGKKFLKELEPFIYRRALDFRITEEILKMKEKINSSVSLKNLENDIKIGKGGIREIEFVIQSIQLIFGGKFKELREKNSLEFLELIRKHFDFLKKKDVDVLRQCYEFLRNLEHKIQMQYEKQTQRIPENSEDLLIVAKMLGFETSDDFIRHQKYIREKVHSVFTEFLKFEGLKKDESVLILNLDNEKILEDKLKKIGIKEYTKFVEIIKKTFESVPEDNLFFIFSIFSELFDILPRYNEKERILTLFSNLVEKLRNNKGYLNFIVKNKSVLEVLTNVFAKSDYLSSVLIKYKEAFEEMFFTDFFVFTKEEQQYHKEVEDVLQNSLSYEDIIENLRIFKHKEHLRIGLHFLNEDISVEDSVVQLSFLANAILKASVNIVKNNVEKRFGKIDSKFAIVALGKFGGMEMNFESDLDVIFIFEKDTVSEKGISSQEYFSRFFQRIISFLTIRTYNGVLYEIDTRLRPSGNAGALVSSFSSFKNYHCKSSAVWERQALLRSRVAAGDEGFATEVEGLLNNIVFEKGITPDDINEILRIRKRIELEEGCENSEVIDIKSGAGGIIDIEFFTQILLLKKRIGEGNTLKALEKLCQAGIIRKTEYEFLKESYLKLRSFENKLRLVKGKSSDKIKIKEVSGMDIEEIIKTKKQVREYFLLYFKEYV